MIRRIAVALLFTLVAVPAHAFEDADYAKAAVEIGRVEIIPAYKALQTSADKLGGGLDALCKSPGDATLVTARAGFADLASAWARVQFVSFGPIEEHLRAARIEYWPDKRNVVGRQLTEALTKQDEAMLEPERFAATTVGIQGLPALERLLFEDDALPALASGDGDFRCRLLAAIANNVETIADQLVTGWDGGEGAFIQRIERPRAEDEAMPSGRDAAVRLLNDILTATIAIRDMKLLAPLGDSLRKAKPNASEYWRSGQSLAVLTSNLVGLRALFGSGLGLGGLLERDPETKPLSEALLASIDQAVATASAITLPLDRAVKDPEQRKAVEALADEIMRVRDMLAGPVATALNLPIGFNALDGD